MPFPIPVLLGIAFGLSEAGLTFLKRSRDDSIDADSRSLRVLWITISLSVAAGIAATYGVPQARIDSGAAFAVGVVLFGLGLSLRWCAILYLGRYFTVNIAIHSGHEVIASGPYRYIRHPAYAGAMLAFAGLALCLDNWVSMAFVTLPVAAAFFHRIEVEETALASALGSPYTSYMRRTRRLLPGLY